MLRTDLTTNKASANVTETESNPITILSAEKQAFAALFCKGIVRQATKQMHNLFAKNGSLHSPEQPMPVLLCGHFAYPQFWRPWCSEQTLFSRKTNRLFIKHFQCFARNFPNRGSPESVTAAQASIALDYCNTEAKMYQSAQKTTRCQCAHKGFGTQNTPNATAFCSSRSPMPFLNPNPLS